jgi:hypothetical protein
MSLLILPRLHDTGLSCMKFIKLEHQTTAYPTLRLPADICDTGIVYIMLDWCIELLRIYVRTPTNFVELGYVTLG